MKPFLLFGIDDQVIVQDALAEHHFGWDTFIGAYETHPLAIAAAELHDLARFQILDISQDPPVRVDHT